MKSPPLSVIEQQVARAATQAGHRLRFDKVALRVLAVLRTDLAETARDGGAVLFTITAPIRLPAKTTAAITNLARAGSVGPPINTTVHGNAVTLRWIEGLALPAPRSMGFVHNPESSGEQLLDLERFPL